jgi:hypothetical protein
MSTTPLRHSFGRAERRGIPTKLRLAALAGHPVRTGRWGFQGHPGEGLLEVLLEVFAGDDRVEEAVGEQEFGALEAFGELLADGLLDDAGAGEADERAGFGDVEVAEHGEAGGDAAGGGVGHDGDVGDFGVVETGQAGGDLGELHQGGDAFHHAGSARSGDDDEGVARREGAIDGAGDGLADDGAHATADEAVLHDGEDDGVGADQAEGVDDGVVETGLFLGFGEAALVGLEVGEVERVGGAEVEIDELVAGFEELVDAGAGVDAEVQAAVGTDHEVGLEVGLPDDLAALIALDPESLGADGLLGVVDDLVVFSFEPGHGSMRLDEAPDHCTGPRAVSI